MKWQPAPLLCAILGVALAVPPAAAQVTGLTVRYSAGQTYITWTGPAPAVGNSFRVYRSTSAPLPGAGPSQYEFLGSVGDSSACDKRFSSLRGAIFPFVIPVVGALDPAGGLFVHTCDATASAYYAVTFDPPAGPEDTTLVLGVNATTDPVFEWIDRPAPLFQRTASVGSPPFVITADVFTLWTSNRSTPVFPAMAPSPSIPFDCAMSLNAGGSSVRSLMFTPHARGGNFMQLNWGSQTPGEYVLLLDDYFPHWVKNTFWIGHWEDYDFFGPDFIPTSGVVEDYTMRRCRFTLEWCRRTLPIDTTKVYVSGGSMGAIGTVLMVTHLPDLIAAGLAWLPVYDFSYLDPDPASSFSANGAQRYTTDLLWGKVQTGLLTSDGRSFYDLVNANWMVQQRAATFVPPLITFQGKNDISVGWTEKPRFFATMQEQRAGGVFFFDPRTHAGTGVSQWSPQERAWYLYRYQTNLSFPAFSNCSTDQDPGDGNPMSGDSVGTINGPLDWDPIITDAASTWSVRILTRELQGRFQTWAAPESLTVDVTPRRAQQFILLPFQTVEYTVTRVTGGAIIQTGSAMANANGILTIPNVKVHKWPGSRLTLTSVPYLSVDHGSALPRLLTSLPNPLARASDLEVQWPAAGPARVDVFDVGGRRVARLLDESVAIGTSRLRVDPRGFGAGVYLLRAEQAGRTLVRRMVVVR